MEAAIPTLTTVTRSSTIEAVGYDPETLTLIVGFKGGARYSYQNITAQMHEHLLSAPSIGGWFAAVIKKNPTAYPCTRLDTTPGPKRAITVYDRHWATVRAMLQSGHTSTHEASVRFDYPFTDADDEITAWLELAAMCIATAASREEARKEAADA